MTQTGSSLTVDEYRSLAQFRHYLRRFMSFSSVAAEAAGLPTQQHQALLAIKAHAPQHAMTIGDLADWLVIAPHSATELVSRLVEADLVRRETDPADRRRQRILLTLKAEDILHRLTETHLAELRSMAPNLIALLEDLNKAGKA
ncbi:MarR family winged helix-turn-helix transcriptional regulator [Brucella pituitosa]|uniref:MarR family winged helix-turn-helix transcriptional regulator n=1 Tax=Brucella pituitosa TaxID=571256 RepID=UPI0009A19772|nr:helix-turn-helix domain-containing protein [Brucella pituitosa]